MSRSKRESERQRIPPPLIKHRVPSGRGAMEQPNVAHDGDARLTPTFWLAVVLTGVAAGLFGDLLMWILSLSERVAFDYHSGSYQASVARASDAHRVISLVAAGVIGAVSWYLIRRYLKKEHAEIDEAVWSATASSVCDVAFSPRSCPKSSSARERPSAVRRRPS